MSDFKVRILGTVLVLLAACRPATPPPRTEHDGEVAVRDESDSELRSDSKKAAGGVATADGVTYDNAETLGFLEARRRRVAANAAPMRMALIMSVIHDQRQPCLLAPEGRTALVPPLDVPCAQGPDQRCLPVDDPKEPWEYPTSLWDTPEWNHIEFKLDLPTKYHYGFSWKGTNELDCTYRIEAYGDLDDDGLFSTFAAKYPAPDGWTGREPNPTALE